MTTAFAKCCRLLSQNPGLTANELTEQTGCTYASAKKARSLYQRGHRPVGKGNKRELTSNYQKQFSVYREQLFALFANGHLNTPTVELMEVVGCCKGTVNRYRAEYKAPLGIWDNRKHRHTGYSDPWATLARRILQFAVNNYWTGKPCCSEVCGGDPPVHYCQEYAARFLRSRWAEFLWDSIGTGQEDRRTFTLRQLGLPLVYSRLEIGD